MRDTIFIGHANPEDNRFTKWLALRLARSGYRVWCDLTGLLGGEDIWEHIEPLIRQRVIKFLYVLSRPSNHRNGVLNELQIATTVARTEGLTDFVIPLKIDDLPHSETNIQLNRLFTTSFVGRWDIGFSTLLEKLNKDGVPKNRDSGPAVVRRWWSTHLSPGAGVVEATDEYLSNWFPITSLPHLIHLHELSAAPPAVIPSGRVGIWQAPYLVSFAPAADIRDELPNGLSLRNTRTCSTVTFLETGIASLPRQQRRDIVYRLLRVIWERFIESRGVPMYEMANQAQCGYFTAKLVGEDQIPFRTASGFRGSRQLVGYRTISRRTAAGGYEPVREYWHFGLEARPMVYPRFAYAFLSHVLFSHDALTIWQNKNALHRARRSACREWWNEHWRDRLLAAVTWLASGAETIRIEMGSSVFLEVSCDPLRFLSPVSYAEPTTVDEDDDSEDDSRGEEDEE